MDRSSHSNGCIFCAGAGYAECDKIIKALDKFCEEHCHIRADAAKCLRRKQIKDIFNARGLINCKCYGIAYAGVNDCLEQHREDCGEIIECRET